MAFQNYRTRALASGDPRFAKIFDKFGPKPAAVLNTKAEDDLSDLREAYKELTGKRAYHAWDAEELRKKIAAASKED